MRGVKKPHYILGHSENGWGVKCHVEGKSQGSLRFFHLADVIDMMNGKNVIPKGSWVYLIEPFNKNNERHLRYWGKLNEQIC
jgi:hypothetical protein